MPKAGIDPPLKSRQLGRHSLELSRSLPVNLLMNDAEQSPAVTHREAAAAGLLVGSLLLAVLSGAVFIVLAYF